MGVEGGVPAAGCELKVGMMKQVGRRGLAPADSACMRKIPHQT